MRSKLVFLTLAAAVLAAVPVTPASAASTCSVQTRTHTPFARVLNPFDKVNTRITTRPLRRGSGVAAVRGRVYYGCAEPARRLVRLTETYSFVDQQAEGIEPVFDDTDITLNFVILSRCKADSSEAQDSSQEIIWANLRTGQRRTIPVPQNRGPQPENGSCGYTYVEVNRRGAAAVSDNTHLVLRESGGSVRIIENAAQIQPGSISLGERSLAYVAAGTLKVVPVP